MMCVWNRFDCSHWVPGQVENVADAPLKAVLRGLGGWPVMSRHWDHTNWTLEVVLGHLKGIHNEAVLIQMIVATDDKNSSAHIMQVMVVVVMGSGGSSNYDLSFFRWHFLFSSQETSHIELYFLFVLKLSCCLKKSNGIGN